MAVKHLIGRRGIGFSPGSVKYILTLGLTPNPLSAVTPSLLYSLESVSRVWTLDHEPRTWELPAVSRTWPVDTRGNA